MKIKKSPPQIVDVKLSILELRAIQKVIGPTSFHYRKESLNLTDEENLAAEEVYSVISDFLDED